MQPPLEITVRHWMLILAVAVSGTSLASGQHHGAPSPPRESAARPEELPFRLPPPEEIPQLPLPEFPLRTDRRLDDLLEQMGQQRDELAEQLEAVSAAAPPPGVPPPASPQIFQSLRRQVEETDRMQAARLAEVQVEILKLRRLLNRQDRGAPAVRDTSAAPVAPSLPTAESDGQAQVSAAAIPPDSSVPSSNSPRAITGSPVDRLSLANNLFSTGDYDLALQIYQQLDRTELEPRQLGWIHYQMACCHRKLGNVAAAEKNYRVVAGLADAGNLADNARWWLDEVQQRRDLAAKLDQLNTSIANLQQETQSRAATK